MKTEHPDQDDNKRDFFTRTLIGKHWGSAPITRPTKPTTKTNK